MTTVHVNGTDALSVDAKVMEKMGLRPGQSVTTDQMWEIIAANAEALADDVDQRRAAGETGMPDTGKLRDMLAGKH